MVAAKSLLEQFRLGLVDAVEHRSALPFPPDIQPIIVQSRPLSIAHPAGGIVRMEDAATLRHHQLGAGMPSDCCDESRVEGKLITVRQILLECDHLNAGRRPVPAVSKQMAQTIGVLHNLAGTTASGVSLAKKWDRSRKI